MKSFLRSITPSFLINFYHWSQGFSAALWYGFPARKMVVIGVTGTNGKTTVCNMTARILQSAGHKVAMATTVNFILGDKEWPNKTKMTTVSPFMLQSFLKQAVQKGCQYAIVETTSHALLQHRVYGVPYDVAAVTNVTHEHLDYHKTMEAYREAKGKLFAKLATSRRDPRSAKISIINFDDSSAKYFAKFEADEKLFYHLGSETVGSDHFVLAKEIKPSATASEFTLVATDPDDQARVKLPTSGRFNIQNALCAAAIGLSQRASLKQVKDALEKFEGVAGRMEHIEAGQPFEVIVDYAHTPDGLEQVLSSLKDTVSGRLIFVGGAAGDRDKTKRPIMGKIAGKYADLVIITNEDPYTEDPQTIIDAVAEGVPEAKLKKILDRKEAIHFALSEAKKGDLVVITGKGREPFMVVGAEKVPWDDGKIVLQYLQNKFKN